jgi:2-polyprenyl-3-methyl-5-hydroxy-6-metoxy-1,4-benzoquinol methylase
MTCIDHTVSHETFQLVRCESCGFIMTSPRPENSALGKYYMSEDYISHSNRSSSVIEKIYQIARIVSLERKINLVNRHLLSPEKRLLDYGCGTGEFLNHARKKGFKIQGVEPSSIARQQAQKLTHEKISETIAEVENQFDAITLWHVLEHIPDINKVIGQLKSILTKNGTIFIAVPNHKSNDAIRYQELWAGYDVPRHLWHFSQQTMKKLLTKNGLNIVDTIPMKLDSFYVSMLSEKYKRKKNSISGLTQAFFNGLRSNIQASSNMEYSSLIYIAKK